MSDLMNQRVNFGKHKGETLAHIAQFDPSYLSWMRDNGLCGDDVINARDRGEYKRKEMPPGYAVVFTWD